MNSKDKLFQIFKELQKVSTDTRQDVKDSIFFALSGENFDGNKFAPQAIQNGAKYAVIDNADFNNGENFIFVDDVLKSLQHLALMYRQSLNAKILAITGSNGKTTTKELVTAVLSSERKTISTIGNFNNHIGVPLSILNIKQETEIAVIEMGANHRGEIEQLCEIALPNIGIITNIGKAHLEGFGNFEGVIATKNELYKSIKATNGEIIQNHDDELLRKLSNDIPAFSYGTNSSDVNGDIISYNPTLVVKWSYKNKNYLINSKLYGSYNFYNIMAAVAVGIYFGISPENISSSIESYLPSNNRSQIHKTSNNSLVLDAYNANPVSMTNAIRSFKDFGSKDAVLILGDMFELGESSAEEHQKIIELLQEKIFKDVFLVGESFFKLRESNGFTSFKNTNELKKHLTKYPIKDKSILIKGSRGMKLESLVEVL
jgi:UDP-N-acetylmuramoyl-tripeptide--D-alanyl-D-alanine ligase